jgi:hypothetical protein
MSDKKVPEKNGIQGSSRIAGKDESARISRQDLRLRIKKENREKLNMDHLPKKQEKIYAKNTSNYSFLLTKPAAANSTACFVATAAFGGAMQEEVKFLRKYRDNYLREYYAGRIFIKVYEKVGPGGAEFIKDREYLKKPVRQILRIIIKGIRSTWKGSEKE